MKQPRALAIVFGLGALLLAVRLGHPLREAGETTAVDAGGAAIDAVTTLVGQSPIAARLPSVAGGLLALVAVAWAASAASRRAAWMAAALLALAPAWYVGARDASGVGPALGTTTLAAAGALHWMLYGRRQDLAIAAASAAAAALAAGLIATLFAPLAVIAVLAARDRRREAIVGAAVIAAITIAVAMIAGDHPLGGGPTRDARPTFEIALDVLGHGLFPWAGLLPIAIGSLLLASPATPFALSAAGPFDSGLVSLGLRSGRTDTASAESKGRAPLLAFAAALAAATAGWAIAHARHEVGALPAFGLAAALVAVWLDDALERPELPLVALVAAIAALLLARDIGADVAIHAGAGTRDLAWAGPDLARIARWTGLAAAAGLALALGAPPARWRWTGLAAAALAAAALAITTAWWAVPAAARATSMAPLFAAHDRAGGGRLVALGGDGHALAFLTPSSVHPVADPPAFAAALAARACGRGVAPIAALAPIERALPAGTLAHVLARHRDLALIATCLPPAVTDLEPLRAAVTSSPPPMPLASTAEWADTIALAGLDVPARAAPGDTVALTFVFRALAPIATERSLFIRYAGCDEELPPDVHVPVGGAYPTRHWRPGDHVVERVTLTIPADAVPCAYDVVIGWRHPDRPRDRLRLDPASVPGNRSSIAEGAAVATITVSR